MRHKPMNLGSTEILLIVAVLFLLFGATRLPQLAKSLGQSKKAFKEGLREAEEEEKTEQQKLGSGTARPQVSALSDAEIEEELRRRAEARAEH
jgi:sec-independent protein translocase protein TatA